MKLSCLSNVSVCVVYYSLYLTISFIREENSNAILFKIQRRAAEVNILSA